jgi:hypothetical protein
MFGRAYAWLWTLLALVSLGGGVIQGACAASGDAFASALARAAQQRQALEQMRELADPAFKPLLLALKDGALYTWQEQLLRTTPRRCLRAPTPPG